MRTQESKDAMFARVETGDREAIGEVIADNTKFLRFLVSKVARSVAFADEDELMTLAMETAFLASLTYKRHKGEWTTFVGDCFFRKFQQQYRDRRSLKTCDFDVDLVPGNAEEPIDAAIRNEEATMLLESMRVLNDLQADTIRRRYGLQGERASTLAEIAAERGRTANSVHVAEKEACRKLRKRLHRLSNGENECPIKRGNAANVKPRRDSERFASAGPVARRDRTRP